MSKLTEAQQTIAEMQEKIAELVAASQAALELVSIVTAERDALAAHVAILKHAALELHGVITEFRTLPTKCLERRMFDTADRYFQRIKSAPEQCLSAHDAEVAAKAVLDFANHLVDIGHLRSAYPAKEYAAQLRAKAKS